MQTRIFKVGFSALILALFVLAGCLFPAKVQAQDGLNFWSEEKVPAIIF